MKTQLRFEDVKAGDLLRYDDHSGQVVEQLVVQAVKPRKREVDVLFGAVETWLFPSDFEMGYVTRVEQGEAVADGAAMGQGAR